MKKNKCCPKCDSLRIGHLAEVPDSIGGAYSRQVLGDSSTPPKGLWQEINHVSEPHHVEAFICADCGYMETYASDPASIPFDRLPNFTWVNPEHTKQGPFR